MIPTLLFWCSWRGTRARVHPVHVDRRSFCEPYTCIKALTFAGKTSIRARKPDRDMVPVGNVKIMSPGAFLHLSLISLAIRQLDRSTNTMALYQPVPLAEGEEDVQSYKRERHESLRVPRSQQSPSKFVLPASIVILCISIINLFIAKRFYRPTNEICTAQISVWCKMVSGPVIIHF
jgi:hypothetical protein